MTYDSARWGNNRQAAIVIELDLDRNDSTYDAEFLLDAASYGTPRTTDDVRAYSQGSIITQRWSNVDIPGLSTIPVIKNISDVRTFPTKAKPGESIGDTARFTAKLIDFDDTQDYSLPDAYRDGREVSGSYFSKIVERNYLKTRPIRVLRGYIENGVFVYTTEHYIVDNWDGPDFNGNFSIEGRDVLTLTNGVKNKSPEVTSGILTSAINNTQTTIAYSATDYEDEYGAVSATGFIAIGSEIMGYTVDSSSQFTVTRGEFGTTAQSHSASASLQKCDAFEEVNIIDVFDYYIDAAGIDSSYKDTANWNALKTGELATYTLTNAIFKPAEIKKILNELVQIGGLTVYTDVIEQKIKIIASSLLDNPVITYNSDEHYIMDTLRKRNKFDKKITRQLARWAPLDYSSNEDNNFTKNFRAADLVQEDASRDNGKDEGKDFEFKWLANSTNGNQVAVNLCQRNVQRFSQLPIQYEFEVDAAYVGDLEGGGRMWVGSIFAMVIPSALGSTNGSDNTVTLQCTAITAGRQPDRYKVTGLAYSANVISNADYTITAAEYIDFVLATDSGMAAVIADKGVHDYVVLISNGATFGSSDTANAAFRQGTFPVGSTLELINQGQIIGAGGNGGDGALLDNLAGCLDFNGQAGQPGGDALDATTDLTIDNSLGLIGGGGGGGAGGASECALLESGNGGGGGQGFSNPGNGGIAGTVSGTGSTGGAGQDGTRNSAGAAGSVAVTPAGDGGGLGENGVTIGGVSGGTAGKAVETNGNTVTITAGSNSAQVKGVVS